MTLKINICFYILLIISILVPLGFRPDSISINLLVITFNNIKIVNIQLILNLACIVCGFYLVYTNFGKVRLFFNEKHSNDKKIIDLVNRELQGITGNPRDMVRMVKTNGIFKATVNTGAWTSYNSANEQVIVNIPTLVLVHSLISAGFQTLVNKSVSFFIPVIVTTWLFTSI